MTFCTRNDVPPITIITITATVVDHHPVGDHPGQPPHPIVVGASVSLGMQKVSVFTILKSFIVGCIIGLRST